MPTDQALRAVVVTASRELGEELLTLLAEEGARSAVAPTQAMVERALAAAPDVILIDDAFPSGELAAALGQRQFLWQETAIVGADRAALARLCGNNLRGCPTLSKPVSRDELGELLRRVAGRKAFVQESGLVGVSGALRQLIETIGQVAPTEISILLTGESGVGKELVARALHAHSPRRSGPFLAANCGALTESILESELFGHERGAFTGAVNRRAGLFEAASGGTILLDEIGEMSPTTQVKLLRVLETREFFRVGGSQPIRADVRVIASTNRNLAEAVAEGTFRRDLYYRLKVFEIRVPPLRERPEDIAPFLGAYGNQFAREHGVAFGGFAPAAVRLLTQYHWPGNVRELRNLVESSVVSGHPRPVEPEELPSHIREGETFESLHLPMRTGRTPESAERALILRTLLQLRADVEEIKAALTERGALARPAHAEVVVAEGQTLRETEEQLIGDALRQAGGSRRAAAKALGMSERTLYRRLRERGQPARSTSI